MKKFLVLFVALTFMGQIGQASEGPGSGNGDDGTLMLADIKQAKGLDDFHTLLYAFERGTVPPMVNSEWSGYYLSFSYRNRNSEYLKLESGQFLGRVSLTVHSRGSLLSPVTSLCIDYTCTSSSHQEQIIRNNSLVSPTSAYLGLLELRVFSNVMIIVERPKTDGTCYKNFMYPVSGVCSISFFEK